MKKNTSKLLGLLLIFVFIIWGCTGIPKNKVATALKNNDACLQECSQKENICWSQYLQCIESARNVWDNAINECIEGPAIAREKCLRLAREEYISALRVCEANYKNCMNDVSRCRSKCNVALSDELPIK